MSANKPQKKQPKPADDPKVQQLEQTLAKLDEQFLLVQKTFAGEIAKPALADINQIGGLYKLLFQTDKLVSVLMTELTVNTKSPHNRQAFKNALATRLALITQAHEFCSKQGLMALALLDRKAAAGAANKMRVKRTSKQIIQAATEQRLNDAHYRLLRLLAERHMLTWQQISTLLGWHKATLTEEGRRKRCQRLLDNLKEADFVTSYALTAKTRARPQQQWYLTVDGVDYLSSVGSEEAMMAIEAVRYSEHSYGINTVLTGLVRATDRYPYDLSYEVMNWEIKADDKAKTYIPDLMGIIELNQPELAQTALTSSLIDQNITGIVAAEQRSSPYFNPASGFNKAASDAQTLAWPFFLEYDRAKESPKIFAAKANSLAYLFNKREAWPGAWRGRFPTVLVVVETTTTHVATLLTKTRDQFNTLRKQYYEKLPSSWWFTTLEAFKLVYGEQASTKNKLPACTPIWIPLTAPKDPATLTQNFADWLEQLARLQPPVTGQSILNTPLLVNHPQRPYVVGLPILG